MKLVPVCEFKFARATPVSARPHPPRRQQEQELWKHPATLRVHAGQFDDAVRDIGAKRQSPLHRKVAADRMSWAMKNESRR
jgi:hypothetical protein